MHAVDPDFESFLDQAVEFHGGLCAGQVLGVKMALFGLKQLGLDRQRTGGGKNLVVVVEIDRCATDAIMIVTGCRCGKRTLKILDYGKMAATFVDLSKNKAVRVFAREEARVKAQALFPHFAKKEAQIMAYRMMGDHELFESAEVKVTFRPEDLPGKPLRRVICDSCGESVSDMRETYRGERTLCKSCASIESYYTVKEMVLRRDSEADAIYFVSQIDPCGQIS